MSTIKRKQFYVTIPMLPKESLKNVAYCYDKDESRKCDSRFPSIPMIKFNLKPEDDYSIVVIWTLPDKNTIKGEDGLCNSERNKSIYYEELKDTLAEIGVVFDESKITELAIPYDESDEKNRAFFKEICVTYEEDAYVYVDLTYGTKISSIVEFASLVYAEKAKGCFLREVIYGKYVHENNNSYGTIYDMRSLYNMSMIIHTCSMLPNADITEMLDSF